MKFKPSTLVELLRTKASLQPDKLAFTFLVDGENKANSITNADLDLRAQAIGAWLNSLNVSGERALLLYPPGLDYIAAFFGCLYAGVIPVPAYPPRLNRPNPRLQAIVTDSQAVVAVTTTAIFDNVKLRFEHTPELETLQWLNTDVIPTGLETEWQTPNISPDTPAFIQYTSGSTSVPKGVVLSHGNLLHNLALINHGFEFEKLMNSYPDLPAVFWLPPYHDMGLIGGILEILYIGAHSILMSPTAFLHRPIRWLQALSRYQGMISGAPNFAYDYCVEHISPEERENLKLDNWKVAFCGAEPIRKETLDRFVDYFEPCGFRREAFYPCYGLAESTLIVSGGSRSAVPIVNTFQKDELKQNRVVVGTPNGQDTQAFVGCGKALLDQKIVIVHPELNTTCLSGEVGEVWVSGPSIAQGYWNKPEETKRTFQAILADTGQGPFLRTGDLGFLHEGELFITGRVKDLIIIRGRNYHPQDIEKTVEECHISLQPRGGAAFSVEIVGEERLVIVQEIKRHNMMLDVTEIISAIRRAVAENHELEIYSVVIIKPLKVPKTSSGKLMRYSCKNMFLENTLPVVGEWRRSLPPYPQTPTLVAEPALDQTSNNRHVTAKNIEDWLIFQLASKFNIEVEKIDIRMPYTSYGLDSVAIVRLISDLETWLGCPLVPTLAWDYPTIETLARHLTTDTSIGKQGNTITSISREESVSLLAKLDQLSDQQVDALLDELLAEEDERE